MTTMQNVAWPMITVSRPRSIPIARNAVLRAMPVTIPGRAIGRMTAKDTASRPKNEKRWTANASSVPRMSATVVAPSAAWSDVVSADRMPTSSIARMNQSSVRPSIGHRLNGAALNA